MSFTRSVKEQDVLREIAVAGSVMVAFIIGTAISLLLNCFTQGGLLVRALLWMNTIICAASIIFLSIILYQSFQDLRSFYRIRRASAFK